jgi:hypothetical protein
LITLPSFRSTVTRSDRRKGAESKRTLLSRLPHCKVGRSSGRLSHAHLFGHTADVVGLVEQESVCRRKATSIPRLKGVALCPPSCNTDQGVHRNSERSASFRPPGLRIRRAEVLTKGPSVPDVR